jgi:hypothetical protein
MASHWSWTAIDGIESEASSPSGAGIDVMTSTCGQESSWIALVLVRIFQNSSLSVWENAKFRRSARIQKIKCKPSQWGEYLALRRFMGLFPLWLLSGHYSHWMVWRKTQGLRKMQWSHSSILTLEICAIHVHHPEFYTRSMRAGQPLRIIWGDHRPPAWKFWTMLPQSRSKTGALGRWTGIVASYYYFKMLKNDILIEKTRQNGGWISNYNEACGSLPCQWQKLARQDDVALKELRVWLPTLGQYLCLLQMIFCVLHMKWFMFMDIVI